METNDIRPFIPTANLQQAKAYYQALGFQGENTAHEMCIMSNGVCSFFLYQSDEVQENKVMLQLSVPSIESVLRTIEQAEGVEIKYEPIIQERWGKIIYLWGPDGEMWHLTEFNS